MQVEIITIGDEILIGQIVDTNAAWMSAKLNKAGFEVVQITSVHDDEKQIVESLQQALTRADAVLFTGGIGPTNDDITKLTLSKYFQADLVFDETVFANIENLLRNRRRAMNELTKLQAMVPDKAIIIQNKLGTAPITWFEEKDKVVVSMPGVPYEMKRAMTEDIIPRLQKRFRSQAIIHQSILVTGYPESALALKIADWEKGLPDSIRLAYLPQFNIVRLRLSAVGTDKKILEETIHHQVELLEEILGEAIIAKEDTPVEQLLAQLLTLKHKTVATAESCTGGYIAHLITSVPGSSAYYKGSVVAYNNDVKIKLLQVDEAVIRKYGAVSREVVEQMAKHMRLSLHTDYAIATSGIAGPDGGSDDVPVGTIWISIATKNTCVTEKFYFSYDRKLNIERTTQTALLMLFKLLRNES